MSQTRNCTFRLRNSMKSKQHLQESTYTCLWWANTIPKLNEEVERDKFCGGKERITRHPMRTSRFVATIQNKITNSSNKSARHLTTSECLNKTLWASRLQLKHDGTWWCTGGEVKGKLAYAVGSQYSSHCLGTWCIQHYYSRCPHLGCQYLTELTSTPI